MATQTSAKTNSNEAVEKKKTAKETDTAKMNIFQKMLAITTELQTVAKNMEVGTGNNKYKAVSERDILDAVKPIEEKYGVYSYPFAREILESNLLESESVYNGQVTKKTTFMTRIMTVYRFINVDNPSDYIETTTFSEGIDAQDKGSGKAMTYGDKYALMKAYKISTGDDPDATASVDENYTNSKTTSSAGANKGWVKNASAKASENANANANAKANSDTNASENAKSNAGASRWKNANANANADNGTKSNAGVSRWKNANANANATQNQTSELPKASGYNGK